MQLAARFRRPSLRPALCRLALATALSVAPAWFVVSAQAADKEPDAEAEPPKSDIEVKGRVFARAEKRYDTFDSGDDTDSDSLLLSIPSARAGLKAKVTDRISLTLEAEFGRGRASIRDGYVQAKGKRWLVRTGRFKMPLSAFTLESGWTFPRADRGLLDDILADQMLLSGRSEGVMGRIEGGGFWDAALAAGVFQSLDAPARVKDLTSVVRASIEPRATEIALVGQRRVTIIGEARGFWAGGLDVTSELTLAGLGLRLWGEGHIGESWHHQIAPATPAELATRQGATFFEVRTLGALRRGGTQRGEYYAEIFFSGGLLDPNVDVVQDHLLELSGGFNVGHWRSTRLTLEISYDLTGRNVPGSLFDGIEPFPVVDRTAALLQVGAAF